MAKTKSSARQYRRDRIRKKVSGTSLRPRLAVFRSISHFYVQLIDDQSGKTLLGFSTMSKEFSSKKDSGNVAGAREFGKLFAGKALESKIKSVVFDRGGYIYHGRVKAFAEGAREGGLEF